MTLLQKRFVRGVSAAIHVTFIAMVLWVVWQALEPRSWAWGEPAERLDRIVAVLGTALALFMAIGLILWLRKGRIEILMIPDLVLLAIFALLVWWSFKVGYLVCLLALAAALIPVLTDYRRQQRSAPPVYWPGYGPGAPANPPQTTGSDGRPAPPPA